MHYIKAKSILSAKNGINLYRGCQHGCIYCDSRSSCYGMEHDFEDVAVKENSIELLEQALKSRRKRGMVGCGSMSDPYMPLEAELGYTKKAMELCLRMGFGFSFITKSDGFLRDLELLKALDRESRCVVQMTLTTHDEKLCKILEPGAPSTKKRYEALKRLQAEGIPAVVWLCPILPYINDSPENLNGILDYCEDAGVKGIICFGMGVTLRDGNREYFFRKLDEHFPGMKERYIKDYGLAYSLESPRSPELMSLFHSRCEKAGIMHNNDEIFSYINRFEGKDEQLSLF